MEFYRFNEGEIIQFVLALLRVSSCIMVLPLFGAKMVPHQLKVLLALIMTMLMFQITPKVPGVIWDGSIIFVGVREVFIGLSLGYLSRTIMFGIDLGGQLISTSLGFNAASLVNPTFNESATIAEQFYSLLGFLIFLSINGHHFLLLALHRSFQLVPLMEGSVNPKSIASFIDMAKDVLILGIKLAAPIVVVSIVLNVAQGIIGRVVPQINVFVTSFQVNILVGLTILLVSLPLMVSLMEVGLDDLGGKVFLYLKGK